MIRAMIATLLFAAPSIAQIRVAMVPADTLVERGTTLDVRFVIPIAGATFNGYEAVVAFDPSMVQPEPMVPIDDQQGSLMLSVCNFCYHRPWPPVPASATEDTLKLTHVTMCGVPPSLTGPGILYRMRFRALKKGETAIRFFRLRFTAGGFDVAPVIASPARVRIAGASPRGREVVSRSRETWAAIKALYR